MEGIVANTPFTGAGAGTLEIAMDDGKLVICVYGHFGNYDVRRATLVQRGRDFAALFRPLSNKLIHGRYIAAIS